MNVFTIIGFLIGFNLFIFNNLFELMLKRRYPRMNGSICMTIDLGKLITDLFKCILLLLFLLHSLNVLNECKIGKEFNTSFSRKNTFADNITITFFFFFSKLIKEEHRQTILNENGKLNYHKLRLNHHLTDSIQDIVQHIYLYARDYFKDKKRLDHYLSESSELIFYGDYKCWKINFDFVKLTGITMNVLMVRHTTLDDQLRIRFNKPYDQSYLSELNLYWDPETKCSFGGHFRKTVVKFGGEFEGIKCLNYSKVPSTCGSRDECRKDCLVRSLLKQHNIYPMNYYYLPKYLNEFDITNKTRFIIANQTILTKELIEYCDTKYALLDCRRVKFDVLEEQTPEPSADKHRFYKLQLSFDEKIEQINYSFQTVQFVQYLTSMFYIYFGTSLSGLFSLLSKTRLEKLNSLKLLFIAMIVYEEYSRLINLYLEKKLIYSLEFNLTDSTSIPPISICYEILQILKNEDDIHRLVADGYDDDRNDDHDFRIGQRN